MKHQKSKWLIALLTLLCAALAAAGGGGAFAATSVPWQTRSGSPSQSTDSYGAVFEGDSFEIYNTQVKLWPDKFGLSYRIDRDAPGTLELIASAKGDAWYADASAAYFRLVLTCQADLLTTDVTLYAGETAVAQFSTVMVNWTDDHTYSTNYVYFGKSGDGWLLNLNDEVTEIADAALLQVCEQTLSGFEDRVGYLQVASAGRAKWTYIGVRYGIPSQQIEPPAGWSNANVLDAPDWTRTAGSELIGWTSTYETAYTLKGDDYLAPLNGLDLSLRMAHGRSAMSAFLMLCSDYDHTWYAGTYSVGFHFTWTPDMGDSQLQLQLLVYTNRTESDREEPIKFTATLQNFKWFQTNRFRIYKSKGVWTLSVNGESLFVDAVSNEGKTLNDYLNAVYPYFPSGGGYLEMWANQVSNEAYVIEELSLITANSLPAVKTTEVRRYDEKTYRVGQTVEIDLSALFTDADEDQLVYFATKGVIEDGKWRYTAQIPEELLVTLRASDAEGSASVKLRLNFEEEQANDGCENGAASLMLLPLLGLAACVKRLF